MVTRILFRLECDRFMLARSLSGIHLSAIGLGALRGILPAGLGGGVCPASGSGAGSVVSQEPNPVVGEASTGSQVLPLVRRLRPDVVLLDMRMPVMDGWAVARALREQGIKVPIVVMTAAESAKRWADEVGAEGYLAKPFGLDELLGTVERFRKPGGLAN